MVGETLELFYSDCPEINCLCLRAHHSHWGIRWVRLLRIYQTAIFRCEFYLISLMYAQLIPGTFRCDRAVGYNMLTE